MKFRIRSEKAMQRLQDAWDENPLMVIGIAAGAMAAAAKLIEAVSGIQSRRAYARRMDRSPYARRGSR